MTVPLMDGLTTVPFVGVDEFRSSPTWLDTGDLVEGGAGARQDAELYNSLLKASRWAENVCDQPLHAHTVNENLRCRVNGRGQAFIHPAHSPIRQVLGLAYGPDPKLMSPLSDLSGVWVEDQRGIVVSLIPMAGNFSSLEFGMVPSPVTQTYITIAYVAGYGNAVITQDSAVNDTQLHVDNATGFIPPQTNPFGSLFGASVARIWEPGVEEAVTMANNYVAGANPLVLSSGLVNAHTTGAQVSEMPSEVRQAVISMTVALLLRDDAGDDFPYPGAPGPTARRSSDGGKAGGLIEEAERLLMPYRRVR